METSDRFNLSRWAIEHANFTRFLIVLLLVAGGISYLKLGQKEDPDFTFRVMVVRAYWPGATAIEMAQQVVDPLEAKLQETPYLDKLQSYAKPGEAAVMVFLREETPVKEVKNIWYQVRKKAGDVRSALPSNLIGPFFNDEFGDTYIAMYSFTTDGFSYAELRDHVDQARNGLLRVPGVEKVEVLGQQEEKVYVEFSYRKFAQLGISFQQLQAALNGYNAMTPAGVLNTADQAIFVRVDGHYDSLQDIENSRFRVGENSFRLGDFAKVYRGYQDPPQSKIRHRGREAIALGVVMRNDANVLHVGKGLEIGIAQLRGAFPVGIEIEQYTDQPKVVKEAVGGFVRSLVEAVVIVMAVSFLSLGFRTGLVVALTIPLVLGVTFMVMDAIGLQLQKISLGALVLALGLLVDDAMIAVEMMARKLEEGYDKLKAASFAYTSTAFPMLTGTLITAAGFLPVGLAKSASGEYTQSMFQVIGIALIVSWFASVYVTPYIGYLLLKEHRLPDGEQHELFNGPWFQRLRRLINWCVEYRWTVIVATLLLFLVGVFSFRFIPKQFFPDSTRLELMVELWLPEGSSFAASEDVAKRMEAKLAQDQDVSDYVAYIGSGSPRFYLPLDQQLNHTNLSQFMVLSTDLAARERLRKRIHAWVDEEFPEVRTKIDRLPNGPPTGWPLQFRVQGPDPAVVRQFTEEVKALVRASPMVRNVHDNWHEPVAVMKIDVDQEKLRVLGISSNDVRGASNTILSGTPIGSYRERNREVEIIARQPLEERDQLGSLKDAYMPTATGQSVPFSHFGKAVPSFEPGVLWRRDRLWAITIQAEVLDGIQSPDAAYAIDAQLGEIKSRLPVGYSIGIAGPLEANQVANDSINAEMPKMLVVILLLLMIQLQHFGRTMLVLFTAPLGIIGAALALLVTQTAFGFVALLGVIALAGIIMRNSVILVDQIEQDIKAGHDPWTAIVESAVRRARPIMLTAAAAVLALIPLVRSVFYGPAAIALMGGLIVATLLTLSFLPALYAAWFKVQPANPFLRR
ncbi:MAG: efflux RND transporter permease subunit [Nevskiaceae bacterium]|nr:MAG: efflux RND transporter permease subunit [Nevskiaceae bacterium]TAM32831.1 MAG: efflux RND transporter permease subunit [Nevskiaceae bacterium]